MGYLDGFGVTIKKWLGPGTDTGRRVTTQYPEQTRPKPERFHGRHVLNRYEDGMEKCIGCELCAGVCPARCIYVRGADNDPDDPTSPGERYGFIYEINYLRCIHCDLCVEACPTEAITESKLFEFAFTNRSDAIYTKAELVVDDEGRPQQLPWENWQGGFDPARDTSGWMRATAPGGDADFVGLVAWAGELGYGVRAPEGGGTVDPVVAEDLAAPAAPIEAPPRDPAARGAFNAPGDDRPSSAPAAPSVASLRAAPAEAPAPTSPRPLAEQPADDVVVTEGSEAPVDGGAGDLGAGDPGRVAGAFDAPEAPSAEERRGLLRRRGATADETAPSGPTDEEIVAALPDDFGAPGEPETDDDASAAVADEDGVEPAAEVPPEPPAATGPAAGTFDAPEMPEQPKRRRFGRRGDRA